MTVIQPSRFPFSIVVASLSSAILWLSGTTASVAQVPETNLPPGADYSASVPIDGLDKLFDGDPKSVMVGHPNTAAEGKLVWIDIKCAEPLTDLAGVVTGDSDPFKNYYPIDVEFWGDSDGNGTFDTKLGVAKLGPGKDAAGTREFQGRLEKTHALRFLVTKQNVQGVNRSFMLSELSLIRDASAPVLKATPDQNAPGSAPKAAEVTKAEPKPIEANASIVPDADKLPGTILPLPEGTKITTSFGTEKDKGADKLFDNDLGTWMSPAGGSAQSPESVSSVVLRFAEPVTNLAGVEMGETDPFKNYYPEHVEFWVDSNGDGRFDTRVGSVSGLKPAKESVARHLFDARLEKVHGLEIRTVRQHVAGGKRVYSMNEMRLVQSDHLPLAEATPNSYRILYYRQPMPEGTTVKASFATEPGKGAELVLDGDPSTFMNGAQGSARAGEPASLFLRLPQPVKDLAGIRLGGSDPFQNYIWQQMQVHIDTNGDGTYDTLAAEFSGPGAGERRFKSVVPTAHGIELRVTQQKLIGTMRAFALNEVDGLVFRDDPGERRMKYVVEDFEDFSSWRTWATQTGEPAGERVYGGFVFVSGAYRPELAKDGVGVGVARYNFKPDAKNPSLWAKRARVSGQEALIDQITFWANPQGYDCTVSFELVDARGTKFRAPAAKLSGDQWQEYTVDINPQTVPNLSNLRYPFKLEHLFLNSTTGGSGDVLLDNITYVGVVDRTKRLRIRPSFEGMVYSPQKPVVASYRVWNALDAEIETNIDISLFATYDPMRRAAVANLSVPVKVPAHGSVVMPVDFGSLPRGHYHARLSASGDGFQTVADDQIAVGVLNGKRINKSAMWFGAMHPMGWIAKIENEFVLDHVVVPLGIDAYRVGTPEQDNRVLLKHDLLFAAGFGGMPAHLRLPNQKNDHRGEPNDYDKYAEYVAQQAREKYLPYKDRIISVEFYNEPDLPGFEFLPEIDTYLKMHAVFRKAFRAEIPGVRIGTGGNTVQHGKEKKDFNRRMYTELASEADVAIWHAHGSLENYTTRHRMVEHWLEQGGRPKNEALLGNSEAGIPAGESQVGFLHQADNLVKKIAWAKSQQNSLFYIWFTTTDTYDPQGGYLNNENWGLITYNQRLKPSGLAYNELIRKLANTTGLGDIELDSRLQACAFRRDDGTSVYAIWPRERGAQLLMRFAASGPVTVTDMFGASRPVEPQGGVVTIEGNGYPVYVEAAPGVTFGRASTPDFITYQPVLGVPPGAEVRLPITLKNVWDQDTSLTVELLHPSGTILGKTRVDVAKGQQARAELAYTMPADRKYGTLGGSVRVRSESGAKVDQILPLTLVVAEKAVKTDAVKLDGQPKSLPGAVPIVLSAGEHVQDLVSDPSTPNWTGAEDLSATASFAHDTKGLYFRVEVRDQTHKPGAAGEKLWNGDSVQVAFYAGDAHTEIGLTESGGGSGFCWIHRDAAKAGKPLDSPIAVHREGDKTIYEAYLPFDFIGVKYEPMTPLRVTFLINEDDGRGRVRLLKWFDGIAAAKSVDGFGHMVLE